MRRRDTFIRSQLLAKIEGETSKARGLLSQRAELQEQRKRANMCGQTNPMQFYTRDLISSLAQMLGCMRCPSVVKKRVKLQEQAPHQSFQLCNPRSSGRLVCVQHVLLDERVSCSWRDCHEHHTG